MQVATSVSLAAAAADAAAGAADAAAGASGASAAALAQLAARGIKERARLGWQFLAGKFYLEN